MEGPVGVILLWCWVHMIDVSLEMGRYLKKTFCLANEVVKCQLGTEYS